MKRYRDIAGDGGSNIVGQVEAQQARLTTRLQDVRVSPNMSRLVRLGH